MAAASSKSARRRERMPGVDEVDIYTVDITAGDGPPDASLELLSPAERRHAAGFRFERDRDRYVHMHVTLRRVLSCYMGVAPAAISFHENDYGKPYVPGDIEFNMSYSVDLGLIAVARHPVGIDIEKVGPPAVTPEMIEVVFGPAERETLPGAFAGHPADCCSPTLVDAFFRGWVRKESVVKAIGKGVSFPLERVESRLDLESFTSSYEGVRRWTCDLTGLSRDYKAALTIECEEEVGDGCGPGAGGRRANNTATERGLAACGERLCRLIRLRIPG